jgi:glycosyltransferase involved in cell wall biosynthesis
MGKGKRIIFTVTNDLNYDQRMQRICSTLQANDHDVLLIGFKKKDSLPLQNQPYHQTRMHCWVEKGFFLYFIYNLQLFFKLLFSRFDIICAIDLDTILPVMFIAKLRRKKLVYDAHEYFTELPEVVNRKRIQQIWKRIESFCIPKTDLRYTVSKGLAGLFAEKYNLDFHVIRNMPRLSAEKPDSTNGGYLLYQGALNEGRGLEALIHAIEEMDMDLMICGEGEISGELRQLVSNLGLNDKITFKGRLRPDELKTLTCNAMIGFNLLENKGLSYYYSLSNKFFDYVMAGVPQVCIGFPEYKNLNLEHEVAILVNDLKKETIANAIRLLEDKDLYQKLHENCLKAREEWNWERESGKLLELYRD